MEKHVETYKGMSCIPLKTSWYLVCCINHNSMFTFAIISQHNWRILRRERQGYVYRNNQSRGWWWPGDTRGQGINSHWSIHPMIPELERRKKSQQKNDNNDVFGTLYNNHGNSHMCRWYTTNDMKTDSPRNCHFWLHNGNHRYIATILVTTQHLLTTETTRAKTSIFCMSTTHTLCAQ